MEKVKQFNFNSLLGIICTALVVFAINKLDGINTRQIEQAADLKSVKDQLGQMVTRGEMANQLAERDRKIDELRKAVDALMAKKHS